MVYVFVKVHVRPVVDQLYHFVARTDTVDTSKALNDAHGVPMDIIIDATGQYPTSSSGADLYVDYIRFAYNSTLTGIKVNCVDGYSNTWLIVGTKNPNTMNMNAKITIMLP